MPVYKATVRQNGALTDDEFLDLNPEGKMGVWKFCKNSDKAKAVLYMPLRNCLFKT